MVFYILVQLMDQRLQARLKTTRPCKKLRSKTYISNGINADVADGVLPSQAPSIEQKVKAVEPLAKRVKPEAPVQARIGYGRG